MKKYPVRLTGLKKRKGTENHVRGFKESDLKKELQHSLKKKYKNCKIEKEQKMKKVHSVPVRFTPKLEI